MHGNKGRKFTEEHKRKIGLANLGNKLGPHTQEWKDKVSKIHKENGLVPPNWKGKKRSPESVEKSAAKRRGPRPHMCGENSASWKGGISNNINKYMTDRRLKIQEEIAGRKKPEQCEICGIFGSELKKGLCFDHDHKTGEFRGWICGRCNTALGLVLDNTEILNTMIEYINNNKNQLSQ